MQTEPPQKSDRQPLSAVIISLNAASRIEACLNSVAFADEIVVVDSGSTDDTVEIAKRHGARVIHQNWLGFGKQKQFAVSQASNDWVLCIDTDERVSQALQLSIEKVLQGPVYKAYQMPRCNRFMGCWLKHGEGYPDWSLRLFNRRHANWSDEVVHEKVVCECPVGSIYGDLLHHSSETLSKYLEKQNRYTTLQAGELYRLGRRATMGKLLLSPLLRFIKFYFLKLGFLDGLPGLVHISLGCINSFVKYAKLLEKLRQ